MVDSCILGRFRVFLKLSFFGFVITSCHTAPLKESPLTEANELAQRGLLRESLDSYNKALLQDPENPIIHRNLGVIYLKAGNYNASLDHFKKSYPQFKDNFKTNFYMGEANRALENYAQALFYYQKALLAKEDPALSKSLAWTYFQMSCYKEALEIIENAQKKSTKDWQLKVIQAKVLLKLKRFNEAEELLTREEKSSGKAFRPYVLSLKGDLMMARGKSQKAYSYYKDSLKNKPLLASSLLGLGKYYLNQSQPHEAITYLEQAMRIKPSELEPYLQLAKAYESSDTNKSASYYKYFFDKASTNPEYLELLEGIQTKINKFSEKSPSGLQNINQKTDEGSGTFQKSKNNTG
ncbi:MAG: tetratricopeptide repeat protein [Oligoflexales bacterium]|nr:tetratricopeptide repeat protein [Oligoflexales bacterium]